MTRGTGWHQTRHGCKSGSAQFLSSKSGERGAERWRQHRALVWAALAHVLRSLLRLLMNVLQGLSDFDPKHGSL